MTSLSHVPGDNFLLNRGASGSVLVAVKMLRSDASAQAVYAMTSSLFTMNDVIVLCCFVCLNAGATSIKRSAS